MSKNFLVQAVTHDNHLEAVKQVLEIPNPQRVIISAAFMTKRGLSLIRKNLEPIAAQATILTGIRNGITSAQGLQESIEIGCTTYAVDTGSRSVIFHPKIYFSYSNTEMRVIIGSANLTVGGLNSNIEASLFLTLKMDDSENRDLKSELESKIDGMISEYNKNVFQINDNASIQQLFDSGRVVDESVTRPPTISGSSNNRDLDTIGKMNLKNQLVTTSPVLGVTPTGGTTISGRSNLINVWESGPLVRRDLTIPTGTNTNPTGSMLFKKGAMEGIDQRHYFRDQVFNELDWRLDTTSGTLGKEQAEAQFQLVIRDINYGIHDLRLSHDSRTDTRTYEQRNSMTRVHWGSAKPIIAREDLLGRTLTMYRNELYHGVFVIEID
ncbi:phospholipase D family protein [Pseudodesulfovibrio sp. JC047]|uniref:phospholipase D family protein n=1 Tax=Pseudodesulfovibrio sp. JC047 TaxID=2683199 RepID=UPI00193ECA72|nr:phospholipase D family protein [Pseudodesulfovibrio sp. JC047]